MGRTLDKAGFGYLLLIVGALGAAAAFAYPVTVATGASILDGMPAAVVNADLMAQRAMLHLTALGIFVVGAIFAASGGRDRAGMP